MSRAERTGITKEDMSKALEHRRLTAAAPDLYDALNRLTARAVNLSAQLHEWEAADVLLPAKLDKAWELLSVEIENARAALKGEKR